MLLPIALNSLLLLSHPPFQDYILQSPSFSHTSLSALSFFRYYLSFPAISSFFLFHLFTSLIPITNLPNFFHTQEKDRNLRRITRMVLVVVAVFIVCWTPIHIFVIISALITIPNSTFQTITWHFCIALGYTNRCLAEKNMHSLFFVKILDNCF